MSNADRCPLCGSTRFTVEPIDVSSGGTLRQVPGLRSCLDCHNGGAPVLLAEVDRLRGLLARLEWAGLLCASSGDQEAACPACAHTPTEGHATGEHPLEEPCWLAEELAKR